MIAKTLSIEYVIQIRNTGCSQWCDHTTGLTNFKELKSRIRELREAYSEYEFQVLRIQTQRVINA